MREILIKIMSQVFNTDKNSINEFSTMNSVENWDSLKHIDLMMSIEEEFEITFMADEIAGMNSFKKITEALKSRGVHA